MVRLAFSLFLTLTLCNIIISAEDSLVAYTKLDQVPQSAKALWESYDPRVEPLDIKIHHEWKKDGVVSRHI